MSVKKAVRLANEVIASELSRGRLISKGGVVDIYSSKGLPTTEASRLFYDIVESDGASKFEEETGVGVVAKIETKELSGGNEVKRTYLARKENDSI